MSLPIRKMTCIEWRAILKAGPERERDVVKQEASSRKLRGSYVLGRSHNKIPNPILRNVKTLEDN